MNCDVNQRIMQTDEKFQCIMIMKTHRAEYWMEWWQHTKAGDKMRWKRQVEPDLAGPEGHVKDTDSVLLVKGSHLSEGGSDINQLYF